MTLSCFTIALMLLSCPLFELGHFCASNHTKTHLPSGLLFGGDFILPTAFMFAFQIRKANNVVCIPAEIVLTHTIKPRCVVSVYRRCMPSHFTTEGSTSCVTHRLNFCAVGNLLCNIRLYRPLSFITSSFCLPPEGVPKRNPPCPPRLPGHE